MLKQLFDATIEPLCPVIKDDIKKTPQNLELKVKSHRDTNVLNMVRMFYTIVEESDFFILQQLPFI